MGPNTCVEVEADTSDGAPLGHADSCRHPQRTHTGPLGRLMSLGLSAVEPSGSSAINPRPLPPSLIITSGLTIPACCFLTRHAQDQMEPPPPSHQQQQQQAAAPHCFTYPSPTGVEMEREEHHPIVRPPRKPGMGYAPPEGEWKDGLCGCGNQLTPSCAIAFGIPCLGLALLSKRLSWSGDARPCLCQRAFLPPDTPGYQQQHYKRTMLRFVSATIVVVFWLLAMLGDHFATPSDGGDSKRTSLQWYDYLLIAAIGLFFLEFVQFVARLRTRARARLRLPPFCGTGGEGGPTGRRLALVGDFAASCLCGPLVVAQMLRHLFDFQGRWDGFRSLREEDVEALV